MNTTVQGWRHKKLLQATVFGLVFGFLLQKGGVAKYHVLIGQLLLTDFTVMKIMLSAILVASVGLYFLHRNGLVKLSIKPTKIGANIIGGLIFGVGFACAGYCPGTGAAALGQGDIPALIVMVGLVAGSYLYAESSGYLKETVETWGVKGKLTLHMLLRVNVGPAIFASTLMIAGILFLLRVSKL